MKMRHATRIIGWMDTVCGVLAEVVVFLLMLLVSAEIVARHVFNSPILGHVETATLSLVLILYLGLPYTQLKRAHIRVDIFISRFKGKEREFLEAFTLFMCLIPSVLMLWATAQKAIDSVKGHEFVSGVVNFPVWPGRCAVAFGFILLSLTLTMQMLSHLVNAFSKEKGVRVNRDE